MARVSRSRFLSATAGAALLPYVEWVRPALAQAAPAKLTDIDHIVILMQENRSFDHYYGTLSGVRGFDDPRAIALPDGRPVFDQPDRGGVRVLPFHLDTKHTSAQQLHDLSHSWKPLHDSWNLGHMDGWVTAHRVSNRDSAPLTMGYYTREDLPFYYALADAFTICDGYHASLMGPTFPNRYYSLSATIDPDGTHGGPATDDHGKRYTWATYPEALERAGITWRIYRTEIEAQDPLGLNVIMNFANFQDAPPTSPLHENAIRERPVQTLLTDIVSGNLPQVTWIVPPWDRCEHPDRMPAAGEDFVHELLQAFWANPKTWARTAFIIVYDENDGLFDHVVPPTPPPGTPGEFVGGLPIGLGFRVPCLVISPFSRGGYVCSDTFDHTSTLRFIEKRFGVEIPNLTQWRRDTCGDLTAAFGFGEPRNLSVPALPATQGPLADVVRMLGNRMLPKPRAPMRQTMPKQEVAAFTRQRRA